MGRVRLVRKREAERDLVDQVEYLARYEPAVARRYLIAVERAFRRLEERPEIGERRRFKERALETVRVWPVPGFRRFLVFYRVTDGVVEILRVLHSARDAARLLRSR